MNQSIANSAEIDVIWEEWQRTLEPLRRELNAALGRTNPSPSPLPARGKREQTERHTFKSGVNYIAANC